MLKTYGPDPRSDPIGPDPVGILDPNAEKVARSAIRDPRSSKRGQLPTHLQRV